MRGWRCVALVCVWGSVAAAEPGGALEKPAFTATPAELLAVAKAASIDEHDAVAVLRNEREVSFDDKGRITRRHRVVYVVRDANRAKAWAGIHADWRPALQDRPVVRGRVIAPSGRAAELDPAKVTEPAPAQDAIISRDRRLLHAEMPALEAGAVVEQEVATADREPLPGGGGDTAFLEDELDPDDGIAAGIVITYSAPVALKARHVERKLPAGSRSRHEVTAGRERWIHEIAPLGDEEISELAAPGDVVAPSVGIATAASWASAARAFRAVIDQRIAAGRFELPPGLPRAASLDAVHAIVGWLDRKVRAELAYISSIGAPQSPAATVQAGEAPSLDRAVLLVALLRQAGIRADVALARSGWPEVDPDLPGIAAFNHALVRARIGARIVWIQTGATLSRAGQLSDNLQGRRVLVIADDTRDLATTPTAVAADNAIRDVRIFRPAAFGPGRVTRMVRYGGVFEGEQRRHTHATSRDAVKRQLADDMADSFGGTLERVSSTLVEDLGTPFEMTLEVKGVRRLWTRMQKIAAHLAIEDIFEHLPWQLDRSDTRVHDFVWPRPYVYELENRIIVPPGYALPAPAPERKRAIGTATLVARQRIEGRTMIASFRFDTGKQRVTPAELAAMQTALQEIRKEVVTLEFELTANALIHAGKPREAIAEAMQLVAQQPTEWAHHSQLAMVLVHAGAGEAARREARAAVAMAPRSAEAHAMLGWVLSFDTLGRQHSYDWDRAGAIKALREARRLDSTHTAAMDTLAAVLQFDPQGRRFAPGADLEGAADTLRAAIMEERTDARLLALALVLLHSGKPALTEQLARDIADGDERNVRLVSAVAAQAGAAKAIEEATALRGGADRNDLLKRAGYHMMLLGRYDVAIALYEDSGTLAGAPPAAAATMRTFRRQPAIPPAGAEPRGAVLDAIAALADRHRPTRAFWDAEHEAAMRTIAGRFLPAVLRGAPLPRLVTDAVQSATAIAIEGDAGAWRATVESEGRRWQLYLVLDGGIAKLVGATDAYEAAGRYALRAGDAQTQARARRLLDWVHADSDKATAPEVLAFRRLWSASSRELALAGALLSDGTDAERALAIAARCPSSAPEAALACQEVLVASHRARQHWSEVVVAYDAIAALRPDRAAANVGPRAWALAQAGRVDEAVRIVDELIAKSPDDRDAVYERFSIAQRFQSAREAQARAEAVVRSPKVTAGELNGVAWFRMIAGSDLPSALELARKGYRLQAVSSIANTVAALEAEVGELDRARTDCWKTIDLHGGPPDDADWYVMGRIYEQLGLPSDAEAAYKRVATPSRSPQSSYALAQKRLAALRAP